jgi:hypothetical protein
MARGHVALRIPAYLVFPRVVIVYLWSYREDLVVGGVRYVRSYDMPDADLHRERWLPLSLCSSMRNSAGCDFAVP